MTSEEVRDVAPPVPLTEGISSHPQLPLLLSFPTAQHRRVTPGATAQGAKPMEMQAGTKDCVCTVRRDVARSDTYSAKRS